MKSEINPRPLVLATIILTAGIFRLLTTNAALSPINNLAPLGAMALFGGCYYKDKWKAYLVPLTTLLVTDIIVNRYLFFNKWVIFYDDFAWVYASFALMVFTGHFIRTVSIKNVAVSALVGALIHWLVSDFGVWLGGGMDITTGLPYPPTTEGLIKCYYLALPYLQNMLIGNLLFGAVLFGGFEFLQKRFPVLRIA